MLLISFLLPFDIWPFYGGQRFRPLMAIDGHQLWPNNDNGHCCRSGFSNGSNGRNKFTDNNIIKHSKMNNHCCLMHLNTDAKTDTIATLWSPSLAPAPAPLSSSSSSSSSSSLLIHRTSPYRLSLLKKILFLFILIICLNNFLLINNIFKIMANAANVGPNVGTSDFSVVNSNNNNNNNNNNNENIEMDENNSPINVKEQLNDVDDGQQKKLSSSSSSSTSSSSASSGSGSAAAAASLSLSSARINPTADLIMEDSGKQFKTLFDCSSLSASAAAAAVAADITADASSSSSSSSSTLEQSAVKNTFRNNSIINHNNSNNNYHNKLIENIDPIAFASKQITASSSGLSEHSTSLASSTKFRLYSSGSKSKSSLPLSLSSSSASISSALSQMTMLDKTRNKPKPFNTYKSSFNQKITPFQSASKELSSMSLPFVIDSNVLPQTKITGNRKQKRDSRTLMAATVNDGSGNPFWTHAVTVPIMRRRSRRLTHIYSNNNGPITGNEKLLSVTGENAPAMSYQSLSYNGVKYAQTKPSVKMAALSSLYTPQANSYFNLHSPPISANAAAVNAQQQNRLKILLNPPPAGFGAGLIPSKKCNFEIHPSGCFDENGSICDNDGQCVCRPGYTIRIANIYCLRPAYIGEACYTTEQCERKVINSGCFNYREEYREENPSAFFGPSQSSWPMGECRCRIGHRFDEHLNACVRSIIGSWCSNVWDCEMADEDLEHIDNTNSHRTNYLNKTAISSMHSSHSMISGHSSGHQAMASTSRNKIANLVCENNICNCSQFFYYNETAEECQYVETYGQSCIGPIVDKTAQSSSSGTGTSNLAPVSALFFAPTKRSIRFRNRRNHQSTNIDSSGSQNSLSILSHNNLFKRYGLFEPRGKRSMISYDEYETIPNNGPIASLTASTMSLSAQIECNYPTVCSTNKTCACAEGYEHQPTMVPQCQRIGGGPAGHYTHYYHSGSSIRSGIKGQDYPHDRSSYHEGPSNVANFFEYVLYFLVPGLIIIFIFKPCFRRIGEWRNHVHQYQSDSDFYLATTANGRPVIAEMSVIGPQCSIEKTAGTGAAGKGPGVAGSTVGDIYSNEFASFAAFAPHLMCHNAYLFDTTDPCYATPIGYGCHPPANVPPVGPNPQQQQAASMALVREKLQTIEESQSEDGSSNTNINMGGCGTVNSISMESYGGGGDTCLKSTTLRNGNTMETMFIERPPTDTGTINNNFTEGLRKMTTNITANNEYSTTIDTIVNHHIVGDDRYSGTDIDFIKNENNNNNNNNNNNGSCSNTVGNGSVDPTNSDNIRSAAADHEELLVNGNKEKLDNNGNGDTAIELSNHQPAD